MSATRVSPRMSSIFSAFCSSESGEKFAEPLHTSGSSDSGSISRKCGVDAEHETIVFGPIQFLFKKPLIERELPDWLARGRLTVLHRVELAEGDAVRKDDVSGVLGKLPLHRVRRRLLHQHEAHLVALLGNGFDQFRRHAERGGEPY